VLSADTFRKTADFSVRLPDRSSDSNFESLLNIIEKNRTTCCRSAKNIDRLPALRKNETNGRLLVCNFFCRLSIAKGNV
jgi:hypothetical protein